jgi:hypothetical protein
MFSSCSASPVRRKRGKEDGVGVLRREPAESVLSAALCLLRTSSSEEGRGREDGVGVPACRPAESVPPAALLSKEGRGKSKQIQTPLLL